MRTYTNQKYGLTGPYRDELNRMDQTLGKTVTQQQKEINNLYNKEISKLTQMKNDVINQGNKNVQNAGNQIKQTNNLNSTQNRTIAQNTFRGLGGKLSESSNLSLLNTAQNVATQSMGTTNEVLKQIDNDMAKAKATYDIDLANANKEKFDLIYDNFYKINEMYISNRELLSELED